MNPLSVVVRTICNVFAWFMIVFGTYVIVHGHLSPGGGFQGGAVVATFMALLLVAHGGKRFLDWVREGLFSAAESIGLLIFLGAGLLGMSTTFFYNFLAKSGGLFGSPVPLGSNPGVLNSAGTVALMNLAVGLEVVAGLSFIIIYMFKGIRIELDEEDEGHGR